MLSKVASKRIYQLDSIKGIFIFLVVLGHLIGGGYSANSPLGLTHYFIYSIHMPMFILISGILSKKETNFKNIIGSYVIPYIIFDFAYVIFGSLIGQPVSWNVLVPSYVYWYILCIAIMKLMFSKGRAEIALIVSIVVSIFITLYIPESAWRWMSVGRVMLLFPVFWIGTLMREDFLSDINNHKRIYIALGIIAVVILYFLLVLGISPIDWATHDYCETIIQLAIKYVYMMLTAAIFVCLFCIAPESAVLQTWGRNSVIIYLLHPFVVPFVRYAVYKVVTSEIAVLIIMTISALILTWVLSLGFLKRAYDLLIDRIKRALKLEV